MSITKKVPVVVAVEGVGVDTPFKNTLAADKLPNILTLPLAKKATPLNGAAATNAVSFEVNNPAGRSKYPEPLGRPAADKVPNITKSPKNGDSGEAIGSCPASGYLESSVLIV